jgi:hypothetical protein
MTSALQYLRSTARLTKGPIWTARACRAGVVALAASVVALAIGCNLVLTPTAGARQRPGGSAKEPYSLAALLKPLSAGNSTAMPAGAASSVASAQAQLPTTPELMAELEAEHVSLRVGTTPVGIASIAFETIGYDENAISDAAGNALQLHLKLHAAIREVSNPMISLPEAIAFETLKQLLLERASAHGQTVSVAAATAHAQQMYAIYQGSLHSARPTPLPSGTTPYEEILSPSAIRGYQRAMTFQQQLVAVAGPPGPGIDRSALLRKWVASHLGATGGVTITGVPGVTGQNVASFIPAGI